MDSGRPGLASRNAEPEVLIPSGHTWYNPWYILTLLRPNNEGNAMQPHTHISAVHLVSALAFTVAAFGTLHLIALTTDNRASRAFIALGF
jgi:hypothetical protein